MAEYLNKAHEREIAALHTTLAARSEWPTWILIVVIHGGWLAIVLLVHAGVLPVWGATPLLIVLCTWHMSLQHELLHGHPTRSATVNKLLGSIPLSIWYPFAIYRDAHILHHHNESLTEPGIDPESNYVSPQQWMGAPPWQRGLWRMRKSFIGRLIAGPVQSVTTLLVEAFNQVRHGDRRYLSTWVIHAMLVMMLLAWLQWFAAIAWWYYLLAVTWPALSLAMIRSLYEHRAASDHRHRTAINEAGLLMRLLYLNNNYHLVHHDLPHLPWYLLPRAYRMQRDAYIAKNNGFVIRGGYWELFRLYALRETDFPVFPRLLGADVTYAVDREKLRGVDYADTL